MGKQKGVEGKLKRPSSSSEAAALLSYGGSGLSSGLGKGFGGYVGGTKITDTPIAQATAASPSDTDTRGEIGLDVDGDMALYLRHLGKRDANTKLKALQALSDMFSQRTAAELGPILPVWAFSFRRVSADNSRQVREAAFQALGQLASKTKRALTPYLKEVMGPWWMGQLDPSAEVAAAARSSFRSVFPARDKQVSALALCLPDTLRAAEEVLRMTVAALADVERLSKEEAGERLERQRSAALLSLSVLFSMLAPAPAPPSASASTPVPASLASAATTASGSASPSASASTSATASASASSPAGPEDGRHGTPTPTQAPAFSQDGVARTPSEGAELERRQNSGDGAATGGRAYANSTSRGEAVGESGGAAPLADSSPSGKAGKDPAVALLVKARSELGSWVVARWAESPTLFKELFSSKSALVRRSTYHFVCALCACEGAWAMQPNGEVPGTSESDALPHAQGADRLPPLLLVAAPLVLGALGEKEASCHNEMWGMILAFLRCVSTLAGAGASSSSGGGSRAATILAVWEAAHAKKAVYPRLWALLRHGAYGSPLVAYPSLLPFLAAVPPEHAGLPWVKQLLESVWSGAMPEGVTGGPASPSTEVFRALTASFAECTLFWVRNAQRFCGDAPNKSPASDATAAAPAATAEVLRSQQELLAYAVLDTLLPAYFAEPVSATPVTSDGKETVAGPTPSRATRPPNDPSTCVTARAAALASAMGHVLQGLWSSGHRECFDTLLKGVAGTCRRQLAPATASSAWLAAGKVHVTSGGAADAASKGDNSNGGATASKGDAAPARDEPRPASEGTSSVRQVAHFVSLLANAGTAAGLKEAAARAGKGRASEAKPGGSAGPSPWALSLVDELVGRMWVDLMTGAGSKAAAGNSVAVGADASSNAIDPGAASTSGCAMTAMDAMDGVASVELLRMLVSACGVRALWAFAKDGSAARRDAAGSQSLSAVDITRLRTFLVDVFLPWLMFGVPTNSSAAPAPLDVRIPPPGQDAAIRQRTVATANAGKPSVGKTPTQDGAGPGADAAARRHLLVVILQRAADHDGCVKDEESKLGLWPRTVDMMLATGGGPSGACTVTVQQPVASIHQALASLLSSLVEGHASQGEGGHVRGEGGSEQEGEEVGPGWQLPALDALACQLAGSTEIEASSATEQLLRALITGGVAGPIFISREALLSVVTSLRARVLTWCPRQVRRVLGALGTLPSTLAPHDEESAGVTHEGNRAPIDVGASSPSVVASAALRCWWAACMAPQLAPLPRLGAASGDASGKGLGAGGTDWVVDDDENGWRREKVLVLALVFAGDCLGRQATARDGKGHSRTSRGAAGADASGWDASSLSSSSSAGGDGSTCDDDNDDSLDGSEREGEEVEHLGEGATQENVPASSGVSNNDGGASDGPWPTDQLSTASAATAAPLGGAVPLEEGRPQGGVSAGAPEHEAGRAAVRIRGQQGHGGRADDEGVAGLSEDGALSAYYLVCMSLWQQLLACRAQQMRSDALRGAAWEAPAALLVGCLAPWPMDARTSLQRGVAAVLRQALVSMANDTACMAKDKALRAKGTGAGASTHSGSAGAEATEVAQIVAQETERKKIDDRVRAWAGSAVEALDLLCPLPRERWALTSQLLAPYFMPARGPAGSGSTRHAPLWPLFTSSGPSGATVPSDAGAMSSSATMAPAAADALGGGMTPESLDGLLTSAHAWWSIHRCFLDAFWELGRAVGLGTLLLGSANAGADARADAVGMAVGDALVGVTPTGTGDGNWDYDYASARPRAWLAVEFLCGMTLAQAEGDAPDHEGGTAPSFVPGGIAVPHARKKLWSELEAGAGDISADMLASAGPAGREAGDRQGEVGEGLPDVARRQRLLLDTLAMCCAGALDEGQGAWGREMGMGAVQESGGLAAHLRAAVLGKTASSLIQLIFHPGHTGAWGCSHAAALLRHVVLPHVGWSGDQVSSSGPVARGAPGEGSGEGTRAGGAGEALALSSSPPQFLPQILEVLVPILRAPREAGEPAPDAAGDDLLAQLAVCCLRRCFVPCIDGEGRDGGGWLDDASIVTSLELVAACFPVPWDQVALSPDEPPAGPLAERFSAKKSGAGPPALAATAEEVRQLLALYRRLCASIPAQGGQPGGDAGSPGAGYSWKGLDAVARASVEASARDSDRPSSGNGADAASGGAAGWGEYEMRAVRLAGPIMRVACSSLAYGWREFAREDFSHAMRAVSVFVAHLAVAYEECTESLLDAIWDADEAARDAGREVAPGEVLAAVTRVIAASGVFRPPPSRPWPRSGVDVVLNSLGSGGMDASTLSNETGPLIQDHGGPSPCASAVRAFLLLSAIRQHGSATTSAAAGGGVVPTLGLPALLRVGQPPTSSTLPLRSSTHATQPSPEEAWDPFVSRTRSDLLRVLFASGISEGLARDSSGGGAAAAIVAATRASPFTSSSHTRTQASHSSSSSSSSSSWPSSLSSTTSQDVWPPLVAALANVTEGDVESAAVAVDAWGMEGVGAGSAAALYTLLTSASSSPAHGSPPGLLRLVFSLLVSRPLLARAVDWGGALTMDPSELTRGDEEDAAGGHSKDVAEASEEGGGDKDNERPEQCLHPALLALLRGPSSNPGGGSSTGRGASARLSLPSSSSSTAPSLLAWCVVMARLHSLRARAGARSRLLQAICSDGQGGEPSLMFRLMNRLPALLRMVEGHRLSSQKRRGSGHHHHHHGHQQDASADLALPSAPTLGNAADAGKHSGHHDRVMSTVTSAAAAAASESGRRLRDLFSPAFLFPSSQPAVTIASLPSSQSSAQTGSSEPPSSRLSDHQHHAGDNGGASKVSLARVAAVLFGSALRIAPAACRLWLHDVRDRQLASAIELFTCTHVSPALLKQEFETVGKASSKHDNLAIKVSPSLREVTATYKKDEAVLDLVVRLPPSYPLRPVEVECSRRVGISESKLRKWILSIIAFLQNENGSVLDAMLMWKANLDRQFEGIEECPICYSVVHTSNHSLPKLACPTCRHKFHAACLYKWFSSSHKSTCPLCQTPF
eukprot:jgi/Mesvir1/18976/Mv18941-RA.1